MTLADPLTAAPPRLRRTRLELALYDAAEGLFVRLGGRALYRRRHLARGRFEERRELVVVPGLPAALEGFTVAHLSDLHAGPFLGPGDLAAVVARVAELEVDLVALTGDFLTRTVDDVALVQGDLAGLRARHGVLAVLGNHDYRHRREAELTARLSAAGVRVLRDEAARLEVGGATLAVVGLEDLEARARDAERARAALRPGDVELVLCHDPARAAGLARPGCAAILAGHTHGGQLVLPLLPALGPPHPGDRVELGASTLIVSRGLGVLGVPLRIGARAELVLVTLTGGEARGGR